MAHLHWVTAAIGLYNLKEGLHCFCDDIVKEQHAELKARCLENCSECKLESLKPNHSCDREKRCPLGFRDCNCRKQNVDLIPCRKRVCGYIYDEIIKSHGATPPAPNWKNTDITQWCTTPWAVAACFITTKGYCGRKCAAEFDLSGILLLIMNNKAFLNHLDCNIDGEDAFTKAYSIRNDLFHSPSLYLQKEKVHEYIDCMIRALKDKKELLGRQESTQAVAKLLDLKKRGPIALDVEQISNLLENDPQLLIHTLKERLAKLTLETRNLDLGEQNAPVTQKRKLDPSVVEKEHQEKTKTLQDLALQVKSMASDVTSLFEHRGENVTKDSESGPELDEAITTDHTNALKLILVWVETVGSDIKRLKQVDERKRGDDIPDIQTQYEMPTIIPPHDGKLIVLDKKQVKGLLQNCDSNVLEGGFGEVYVSNTVVPQLGVRVAIKKIVCGKEDEIKMSTISNEKIASRVMHFAIVPLIAYMDEELEDNKRAFYFISPYLQNRSLFEIIAKDKKCSNIDDIHLNSHKRKRILFQIASALDYLHTKVPGFRGAILHMDLTTTNIVLDENWNARVIDFGLAREMNEEESTATLTRSKKLGTKGYWPTDNYSKLRVFDDYYNLGVVTRELLTGKAPFIKNEIELRKASGMMIGKLLQNNIWRDKKEAKTYTMMSTKWLNSREDKNVYSADIVKDLKSMFEHQSSVRDTCDLCIVNPAVETKRAPQHGCTRRMNVCFSCMRNSHVNPIRCPTCNETVTPNIGHTYSAVLIAGNDDENEGLAKSFTSDVLAIKDVLSSKCPCVVGISDKNIRVIVPPFPGKEGKANELNVQVHEAFRSLGSKKTLGTLLVYFTGHYIPDTGFKLGSRRDILTLEGMREAVLNIYKQWGETSRIFLFLDCCKAPCVTNIPEFHAKIIQINACRVDESCYQTGSGSIFRIFFCQSLTRKAYNKNCYNSTQSSSNPECEDCAMSGDIIEVPQLLRYISKHMDKCYNGKDPIQYMHGTTSEDSSFGYNVDFVVDLNLRFETESGPTTDVAIKDRMFCDIQPLKKHILETVLVIVDGYEKILVNSHNLHDVNKPRVTNSGTRLSRAMACAITGREESAKSIQSISSHFKFKKEVKRHFLSEAHTHRHFGLTPVEYSDAIALRIKTGIQHGIELRSMLNVSAALDGKREIVASYRTLPNILNGLVVVFMDTTRIIEYLDNKRLLVKEAKGKKARLSLEQLHQRYDEISDGIANMPKDEKDMLRKFLEDVLLKVIDTWERSGAKGRELEIFFPNPTGDKRSAFIAMDISDCSNS